jgi:galactokinase
MDQLASALGQPDHALFIDCRSLQYQAVPIPKEATILIADTGASRELASSAYNERRAQCEAAAAAMGVSSLREATIEKLNNTVMDEVLARRARHVIEENQRVTETVSALREGNLQRVGLLMDSSHVSMRELYEISSRELDTMVELLRSQKGCFGARLTGAGFGGCAVALMRSEAVKDAIPRVVEAYEARIGLKPSLYPTRGAAGANFFPLK